MKKEKYARSVLLLQVRAVRAAALRFRASPTPTAVHRFRVALRRERTLLKAFEPFVGGASARRALGSVSDALGAARDRHVFREKLGPAPAAVARWLRTGERRETKNALRLLPLCLEIQRRLSRDVGPVSGPPEPPASYARWARGWMSRRLKKLRKAIRKTRGPDAAGLHRARIEAKELRYVADTLPNSAPARRVSHAARALQTVLGDIHDLSCLEDYLRCRAAGDVGRRIRRQKVSLFRRTRRRLAAAPDTLRHRLQKIG